MAETKPLGPVQITGNTLEEVKRSVQAALQYIIDRLNQINAERK